MVKTAASEGVYRVIDVIGSSATSWEDATKKAVETAGKSLRDLRVAEVTKLDVKVESAIERPEVPRRALHGPTLNGRGHTPGSDEGVQSMPRTPPEDLQTFLQRQDASTLAAVVLKLAAGCSKRGSIKSRAS